MNTAILSQVGQSAGIGFTVPINAIKRILRPLIDEGRVVRADLGLSRIYRTNARAARPGRGRRRAGRAAPGSGRSRRGGPATARCWSPSRADLIVAIDGKPVKTYEDLLNEVEAHAPGDLVQLQVIRGGKALDLPVTLGRS